MMKRGPNMLNLSYDKQFDILYARCPFSGHSYGEESADGVITFHNIQTDSITGVAIYSFKERLQNGTLSSLAIPLPLDFNDCEIKQLISEGIPHSI